MSAEENEVWCTERLTPSTELRIKLGRELARVRSVFQEITVHETEDFGRMLRLDGCNMTSERDEFCYHEPMVHPALLSQAYPRSVLIIGGGDGGAAKEALKHKSVERVVIAELDEEVVRVSRQWLGAVHQGALDDPRVTIAIGDGYEYLKQSDERFDLIVMDLTDPGSLSDSLYSESFFEFARNQLSPCGVLTTHLGSRFFHRSRAEQLLLMLRQIFPFVRAMNVYVPSYGAQWSMACSSLGVDVVAIAAHQYQACASARGLPPLRLCIPEQIPALFASAGTCEV